MPRSREGFVNGGLERFGALARQLVQGPALEIASDADRPARYRKRLLCCSSRAARPWGLTAAACLDRNGKIADDVDRTLSFRERKKR
jgi:hypothetical protein